jgi:3'(2'), 5'-bisphosphate nucleotidase
MNQSQIYPRFAPTMEWDIAAGQAILEGIGGGVFDINTKLPLSYNKESLLNPHFIAVSDVNLSVWI